MGQEMKEKKNSTEESCQCGEGYHEHSCGCSGGTEESTCGHGFDSHQHKCGCSEGRKEKPCKGGKSPLPPYTVGNRKRKNI